jgi:peroxiredoxin Q/BCP
VTEGGPPTAPAHDDEARPPQRRRTGVVVTIVVGAMLAVGAFLLAREQATTAPEVLAVGDRAPAFALTDDAGDPVALAASPGRPTIVAFLGTGCGTCQEEAKELVALARGGVRVLAVDAGGGTPEERATFAREGLAGLVPIAADPSEDVLSAYRAVVVPTVYAVRADGTIADAWAGRVAPDRFAAAAAAAGAAG